MLRSMFYPKRKTFVKPEHEREKSAKSNSKLLNSSSNILKHNFILCRA